MAKQIVKVTKEPGDLGYRVQDQRGEHNVVQLVTGQAWKAMKKEAKDAWFFNAEWLDYLDTWDLFGPSIREW